jgi:hypothetical protein
MAYPDFRESDHFVFLARRRYGSFFSLDRKETSRACESMNTDKNINAYE